MVIDTVMLEHLGQKRQDTKFGLWKTAGAEAATNVWLLKDVRNEEPFYLCIIFIVQQKGAKHKKIYIYMHIIHIFSKTGNSKSSEPKHQNSQTGIPCAANGINRAAWKRKCGGKTSLISGKTYLHMYWFKKIGVKPRKWMVYNGNPMNKWMIWGYHYFWKHPYVLLQEKQLPSPWKVAIQNSQNRNQ